MTTMDWQLGSDGVVLLTIDVQERSMNVMTPAFLEVLGSVAVRLRSDVSV
jgi:hypothetical protein